jgi:ABC-type glycerol-3-phosphate transport system permease component
MAATQLPAPRLPSPALVAGHAILIALCFLTMFPLYWMFVTSLRPANEILSGQLIPSAASLENYVYAWTRVPLGNMLLNTLGMAIGITAGHLLISILAAYPFARWSFPGDRLLFLLFIGTWLVPFQVIMIPNYVLLSRLGWLNTMAGLVIPQLATAFGIILMRQYMKSFPRELLDASVIDGAGNWRILWAVMIPNLRAPLSALGILYFISAWNEYFWPLLVTNKPETTVVQVGLQMFQTAEGDQWGPLMAAAAIASLPIFAMYVLLQRHIIDAFIRSGLK